MSPRLAARKASSASDPPRDLEIADASDSPPSSEADQAESRSNVFLVAGLRSQNIQSGKVTKL